MDQTVLINGANGFLGLHTVEQAVKAGWRVRASDLSPGPNEALARLDVEYRPADLADMDQARRVAFGCDRVINVAGLFRFDATKEALYRANVLATRNMCQASLEVGAERLVQVATIGVYGRLPMGYAVKENFFKLPKNDYEKTKKRGEDVALGYWKQHGLPVVSLRPTVIYGPGSRYAVAFVIAMVALFRAAGMKDVYELSGGTNMSHVHVVDVARALVWLLDHGRPGEAYNCADQTPLTWGEIWELAMKEFGLESKRKIHVPKAATVALGQLLRVLPEQYLQRANDALSKGWKAVQKRTNLPDFLLPQMDREFLAYMRADHLMNTEKLRQTGFVFEYPDTKAGLRETIAWYKEQGWVPDGVVLERPPKDGTSAASA